MREGMIITHCLVTAQHTFNVSEILKYPDHLELNQQIQ